MSTARDPLGRLRAATAAASRLGLDVAPAGAEFAAATQALVAVRDHVRTASSVGRK